MYQRRHLNILKSRMAEPRRRMQIVMGPRQVGKSTLVGQFTEEISVPFDFFAAGGVNRFDSSWIPNKMAAGAYADGYSFGARTYPDH